MTPQATLASRSEDGQLRLVLGGEIDMDNADDLEREMHDLIGNQTTEVVVDLRDVSYLDSSGIRLLVLLASRLDQINVGLRLVVSPGSLVKRVIEVTGLEGFASDP